MGKAKLRTKTGCMTCRERRKKCDEIKPVCTGCSRNRLNCVWPSTTDFLDRRNHPQKASSRVKSRNQSQHGLHHDPDHHEVDGPDIFSPAAIAIAWDSRDSDHQFGDSGLGTPSPELNNALALAFPGSDAGYGLQSIPQTLLPSVDLLLLPYYTNSLLPSLLHQNADPRYLDFSYTYRLALESPTLTNAAIACSSIKLAIYHGSKVGMEQAMKYYGLAVSTMREGLENGTFDGSEDWLLAAVLALCLFENRRPDSRPRLASTHISAIAEIFRVRREKRLAFERTHATTTPDLMSSKETAVLLFERTSAESFLYHGLTMTLFDRYLDPDMVPRTRDVFDDYFRTCPLPTEYESSNWPILGMPYALFRLIADVSALAKRLPITDPADLRLAANYVDELGMWEERLGIDIAGSPQFDDSKIEANPPWAAAALYLFVAKILALRLLSASFYSIPTDEQADLTRPFLPLDSTDLYIRRCITIVKSLDLAGVTFNRFYLFPLSILGCAAEMDEDVHVVREKLHEIRRGQSGTVGIIDWITETIEGIWAKTGFTRTGSGIGAGVVGVLAHGVGLELLMQDIGD